MLINLMQRTADPAKTFAELATEWMRTRGASKRSRRTDETFLRKHLLPRYGATPVASIDYAEGERLKAVLSLTLKPASINRILTLLRAMLRFAGLIGWIDTGPAPVRLLRSPKQPAFKYLRTGEEIRRFLRAAKALPSSRENFVFALYAAAVYSGLRLGELCALTRDKLEFDRGIIRVDGSHDGPTKSGDVREVPMLDVLRVTLEEHLLSVAGELVFPSASGTRLDRFSRVFQEDLRTVLTDSGLPKGYITFHSLRHTFASHWVMKGGDLFKLQKILGHSSIDMTMRYAHLAPNAFDEDLARFNSLQAERPELGKQNVLFFGAKGRSL